jgi:serine/threonine protein kinase
MRPIGKGGALTSWIVKTRLLKKVVGGQITNCQKSMDDDVLNDNPHWLKLSKLLQNIPNKGIATMIEKIQSTEVVVKVQLADKAKKEYDFQESLSDLEGFAKVECYFTCDGTKEYIDKFSYVSENTKLCKATGSSLGIIVMPYYKGGSLESVLHTISKQDLKYTLVKLITNYVNAYRTKNFTHGDFFCKNVVLDGKDPIIIDFENSTTENIPMKCDMFWHDLDNMFLNISRRKDMQSMFDIARVLTLHRLYRTEPTEQVINDLLKAIENI